MAAPGDWRAFDLHPAPSAQAKPMPFETPGESFPGSAFFYLQDTPQSLPLDTGAHWDGDPAPAASNDVRFAARPFRDAGTGVSKARALQCLAMAVYYEAANETTDGQRAVAQVVLNRVMHPSFPDSVCGVVFQGSERQSGCQFTFTCDGSLDRRPMAAKWAEARTVAEAALNGFVFQPVGLATHYHATYVRPYWASSLDNVLTIGLHTFYRWRGAAGMPQAFAALYRGGEPVAAPHPKVFAPAPDSAPDPVVLAQAYDATHRATAIPVPAIEHAQPSTATYAPPDYSAEMRARGGDRAFTAQDLPDASGVKAEYANSGRWIAQPN